jgi:hypothetical protein
MRELACEGGRLGQPIHLRRPLAPPLYGPCPQAMPVPLPPNPLPPRLALSALLGIPLPLRCRLWSRASQSRGSASREAHLGHTHPTAPATNPPRPSYAPAFTSQATYRGAAFEPGWWWWWWWRSGQERGCDWDHSRRGEMVWSF